MVEWIEGHIESASWHWKQAIRLTDIKLRKKKTMDIAKKELMKTRSAIKRLNLIIEVNTGTDYEDDDSGTIDRAAQMTQLLIAKSHLDVAVSILEKVFGEKYM